jgi:hypothetical protein
MAKANTRQPREPAARAHKAKGNVPKAHVPKAGNRNKRHASDGTDDDSASNEEVVMPRRRKKAKPAQAVEEVDDDFNEPEIEVVESDGLGEESNEVLWCNHDHWL